MNTKIEEKVLKIKEDIKTPEEKDIISIQLDERTIEDIHMTHSSLKITENQKGREYEELFEALTILAIKQGLESIWSE